MTISKERCPLTVKLGTVLWLASCLAGLAILTNYSSTPGIASARPLFRPDLAELPRGGSRASLMMFVHPHCPCSSASINELARIAANARSRLELTIVFVVPPGCPPDWHHSATWDYAKSIPGLHVIADNDGKVAMQMGITTSGHCLVFDAEDKLSFSGGITAGRGHEGDTLGRAVITEIASQSVVDRLHECPTFGCPLNSIRR